VTRSRWQGNSFAGIGYFSKKNSKVGIKVYQELYYFRSGERWISVPLPPPSRLHPNFLPSDSDGKKCPLRKVFPITLCTAAPMGHRSRLSLLTIFFSILGLPAFGTELLCASTTRGFPVPYVRIAVWLGRRPDAELRPTYSISSSARTSSVGNTSSAPLGGLEIDHRFEFDRAASVASQPVWRPCGDARHTCWFGDASAMPVP
jgi:hypothetical protein